jgi:hypothetical protein
MVEKIRSYIMKNITSNKRSKSGCWLWIKTPMGCGKEVFNQKKKQCRSLIDCFL